MKQLIDCSIALSTWQEISPEEAATIYRHGVPILLYYEAHLETCAGSRSIVEIA